MPGSINHIQHQQPGSAATQAAAGHPEQSCARRRGDQQQHSSTGVVVDECMMRWVPYKHANGMAIYYRQTPQEEGRGMPQVGKGAAVSTHRGHLQSFKLHTATHTTLGLQLVGRVAGSSVPWPSI